MVCHTVYRAVPVSKVVLFTTPLVPPHTPHETRSAGVERSGTQGQESHTHTVMKVDTQKKAEADKARHGTECGALWWILGYSSPHSYTVYVYFFVWGILEDC